MKLPYLYFTLFTVASTLALIVCSIFMASNTNKLSPFLTYCPSSTNNLNRVEGIGLVMIKGSLLSPTYFYLYIFKYYYKYE